MFSTKCAGSVIENICASLTHPSDPCREETATPSPAPFSWGGEAWWRTEGNNYKLVITSSLNGFSLISDGFTSNLKVIMYNLSGFSLWGRCRSSGGACRGEVSPLSARAMKNSHVHGPARNNRGFSSSQEGARAHTAAPSSLDDRHSRKHTQVAAQWGTHSPCFPSGSNANTQIWVFQGYFTAELVTFRGTKSDQIGQKDVNYITQRSSENPAPEHKG